MNTGREDIRYVDLSSREIDHSSSQLRDGSTLSAPSKQQHAGVPPPRGTSGRLPGGACVPPLLEGWKHKILLAGKYLNVIRECGIEANLDQSPFTDDLSMDDEQFVNIFPPLLVSLNLHCGIGSTNS
jgi:hypothetical protein